MTEVVEILSRAKNLLDITWDDDSTDSKLSEILQMGIAYLEDKAGGKLDFSYGSQNFDLLMSYARYALACEQARFGVDYTGELLALRQRRLVADGCDAVFL